MNLHGDGAWKLAIGVVVLLFFLGVGIGHILYPEHFMKRSAVRKGGEMLNDWNRGAFQLSGLVMTLFAGGILYKIIGNLFRQ